MVQATHSIRQFPLHFPSNASPCAITFQLESTSTLPTDGDSKLLVKPDNLPNYTVSQSINQSLCTMSRFHRSVNEIFGHLECYAAFSGGYGRFGSTYRVPTSWVKESKSE